MNELCKVFKNRKSILVDVELYQEDGENYIFISHNGSSGCRYKISDIGDIGKHMEFYVTNYLITEEE